MQCPQKLITMQDSIDRLESGTSNASIQSSQQMASYPESHNLLRINNVAAKIEEHKAHKKDDHI